jgi:hypothetical protein
VALLHYSIDSLVIRDHGNRDAIGHFCGAIVHDEQVRVWLRRVGVSSDRDESEASSSVESELLAGNIACLEVVYFKHLKIVSIIM